MTKAQQALQRLRQGNQRFASEANRGKSSPHTHFIAERIKPALAGLLDPERGLDRDTLVEQCVRANVRQSVEQLRHGLQILERLIETDELLVVGAEYSGKQGG